MRQSQRYKPSFVNPNPMVFLHCVAFGSKGGKINSLCLKRQQGEHHSGRLSHDVDQMVSLLKGTKSPIETHSVSVPERNEAGSSAELALYVCFLMPFLSFWSLKLRSWVIHPPARGSRCQEPEADLGCVDSEQGWPGGASPVSDRGTSVPQNQPWRGEKKANSQHKLTPPFNISFFELCITKCIPTRHVSVLLLPLIPSAYCSTSNATWVEYCPSSWFSHLH